MLGSMLGMALGRVPHGKLLLAPSSSLTVLTPGSVSCSWSLVLGKNYHSSFSAVTVPSSEIPPGGNQGGDIASPFLSFKRFWWERDTGSLGILTTAKLQNYAEEMLDKHHLSEIKALEETRGER